jgi:hypothetical protein
MLSSISSRGTSSSPSAAWYKRPWVRVGIALLLLLILSAVTGSCFRERIVRQGVLPPDEARGALYVAQDKPILVGVEGTDKLDRLNMAGYYLISPEELQGLVACCEELERQRAWKE